MEEKVEVGPDLNATRPDTDKKQYRVIRLKENGLECLLVSDVHAAQSEEEDGGDEDENQDEDGDRKMTSTSEADGEEEIVANTRRSAVCLAVGVGSFQDPEDCQGLAHFLEHMLFMGSTKYPRENEFDEFISKQGGDSNAYTEGEHTSFHFTTKTASLEKALDIFAQFFVSPLMLKDSVSRELNSIESEFQMSKSSDANRLQEVACRSSRQGHPLSKFSWGNLRTLKGEAPFLALKPFYDQYYVAENMKLCICSTLSLDEIQHIVVNTCSAIRSRPESAPPDWVFQPLSIKEYGYPYQGPTSRVEEVLKQNGGDTTTVPMSSLLLDERVALSCVFHVVPLTDTHKMCLTWQLPSQLSNYKSKPNDYISHLLGHESEGSVLSIAKARGWATSLLAGGDDGGYDQNTGVSLFPVSITLTKKGMCAWKEVVGLVLEYISMLRALGPQEWVYKELSAIANLDYKFLEDSDPMDMVQDHAMNMLPQRGLAKEDLLKGPFIIEEWNPEEVMNLLQCFTLSNLRVDLVSSLFGRDRDYVQNEPVSGSDSPARNGDEENETADIEHHCETGRHMGESDDESSDEEDEENDDSASEGQSEGGDSTTDSEEILEFASQFDQNPSLSGTEQPLVEPYFGTRFWVRLISESTLAQWQEVIDSTFTHVKETETTCTPSGLILPRRNPYIAEDVSLKPFSQEYALHPLVGAYVKARLGKGKKQSWTYGFVLNFDATSGKVRTAFEDDIGEDFTEFMLGEGFADPSRWDSTLRRFEMSPCQKQNGKNEVPVECFLVSARQSLHAPQQIGYAAMRFFDIRASLDSPEAAINATANRMPKISPCFVPQLAKNSNQLFHMWCLQDRVFQTPKTTIYLNIICGSQNNAIRTLSNSVATDLFIALVVDSLTDESYLASMAELEYGIRKSEAGIRLQFQGFSDKLLRLVDIVLEHLLFKSIELTQKVRNRFTMHRESLIRSYRNSGTKSEKYASNLRLRALKPSHYGAVDMLHALEESTMTSLESLVGFVKFELFQSCMVDSLACGNIEPEVVAVEVRELVTKHLTKFGSQVLSRTEFPPHKVLRLEPGEMIVVSESGKDPNDKNSSLEVYFQIGPDSLSDRVVLDMIEHLMEEPIYDQLRTKKQLGYSVSCGVRITNKILGFVVRITSAKFTAPQLQNHAFAFLVDFLEEIEKQDQKDFEDALQTLVEVKLEDENNLFEGAKHHWNVIADHSFFWNESFHEAFALFGVSKSNLIECYKTWLLPTSPSSKILSVQVTGPRAKPSESPQPSVMTPHQVNTLPADQITATFHTMPRISSHYCTDSLRSQK